MKQCPFVRIVYVLTALSIPVVISLPGLRQIITVSSSGVDIFWLLLWIVLVPLLGGPKALGGMMTDQNFLTIAAHTLVFWMAWAYWLLFILKLFSTHAPRYLVATILSLFWCMFLVSIASSRYIEYAGALESFWFVGICFGIATLLELMSPDAMAKVSLLARPVYTISRRLALVGSFGMVVIGSLLSSGISRELHSCGSIAVMTRMTGCTFYRRDRGADSGDSWAYHADLMFTDDGRYLIAGSQVFDLVNGRAAPTQPAIRHRGRIIATDGTSTIEDWNTRLAIYTIEGDRFVNHLEMPASIRGAAYSPDGKLLVIAYDGAIELWQTSTWQRVATRNVNAYQLQFSRDGDLLATLSPPENASVNGASTISLWQGSTYRLLQTRALDAEGIQLSPDGALLAVSASDIKLLRTSDLTVIQSIPAYAADVAFSPDGSMLASAEQGGVRIHAVADGSLICTIPTNGSARSVAFTPDGTRLALTDWESAQVWDWQRCPTHGGILPHVATLPARQPLPVAQQPRARVGR